MGAVTATRPLLFALLLLVAGGCSSPPAASSAAAPIPPAAPAGSAAPIPPPAVDGAPFHWPEAGWLRLDLDVFVVLDDSSDVAMTATVVARWEPGRVETWIEGPDPADPDERASTHRVDTGAVADRTLGGLRGDFGAGLADGLLRDGTGALGGAVFTATERHADTTLTERWEIGVGAWPFGPGGPFDGRP